MLQPFPCRLSSLVLALLVGFASLSFAGARFSNHYRFERIGLEEGLSQSTIKDILQDQVGYLWIATDDGLNRYDGYSFKVYRNRPFDPSSLASSQVDGLFEQRNGTLWIMTRGGLCRYQPETETFTRFPRSKQDPADLAIPGLSIFEDSRGQLWFYSAVAGNLSRLDREGRFTSFFSTAQNNAISITGVCEDQKQRIWAGSLGQGLLRYDPKKNQFVSYMPDPSNPESISSTHLEGNPGLLVDDLGYLWLSTPAGLDRFDPETRKARHYPLTATANGEDRGQVIQMKMDASGFLWVATRRGLLRFDPQTGRWREFFGNQKGQDVPVQPSDGVVLRSGQLWITTLAQGLAVFNREEDRFDFIRHNGSDPHSLGSDVLTQIFEDRGGTVWIGSQDSGLFKYSPAKQKFRHYLHPHRQPKPITSTMVWSLLVDHAGDTWVGTARDGLLHLDQRREKILRQYHPGRLIRSLFEDSKNRLWYSCNDNGPPELRYLDLKTGESTFFASLPALRIRAYPDNSGFILCAGFTGVWSFDYATSSLSAIALGELRGATSCAFTSDGRILVGANNGLSLVEGGKVIKRYTYDPNNRQGLSFNRVLDIYRDANDIYWLALSGGGLNRFDLQKNQFEHFTTEQGLANDFVYNILPDEEGNLWLSTNRGLSRFSPKERKFRNYDTHDGLQSVEFNMDAATKAADGELLFGGVSGFNAFYTSEVRLTGGAPSVAVSAWIRGDKLLGANLRNHSLLELEPGEPMLVFTYAGLDYVEPSKNTYAYQLEGFDPEWQYVGDRRRAAFTNLAKGEYLMRIKAANSDGIWSEHPAEIRVRVKPRFYETTAFAVSAGLGAVGLLLLLFLNQRHRHQRRQEEALRWRDHMRKSEELEFARRLQLAMIPKKDIRLGQVEVVGQMITATEVGGDYFDFFRLDDKRLCIAYGDATGHGVAAGLIVGMVKLAATVWAMHPKRIEDMLADLNQGLRKTLPLKTMGMGFGLAVIDLDRYEVEVCSSGMPYPLHFVAATGQILTLELKGPPLGYLKRITPTSIKVRLAPGDRLIFLSDGFAERFDAEKNLWGTNATQESLRDACLNCVQPAHIAARLIEDCDRFAGARPCDDDMTIVVLQREAAPAEQPQKSPALTEAFITSQHN